MNFAYTKNPGGHPVFDSVGQPLDSLTGIYYEQTNYVQGEHIGRDGPSLWRVVNTQGLRSGQKFLDVDGNGEVDIVYHPEGLGGSTETALSAGDSRIQVGGQ